MRDATIVQLGSGTQVSSVSFQDAFGEYSEARGSGRARREAKRKERQARRMERIKNRDERKAARQEARATRKEGRIARRATAAELRQQKKAARVAARQERKGMRQEGRIARRGRRQEAEEMAPEMDETTALETGAETSEEQGYAPTGEETQGGPVADGGYADEGTSDSGYGDEGSGESSDEGYEEGGYEEEGAEITDEEASEGFDGELDFEENTSDFVATVKVPKEIQDLANKIEWNKELVSRLRVKGAEARGKNQDTTDIQNQINARLNRINELQTQMKGYVNAEGDYACADGSKPVKKRMVVAKKAFGTARKARMMKSGPAVTPVAEKLNPSFGPNSIVVPAAEGTSDFSGTGLVGIDQSDDYDAPETRIIEMQSGFDGVKNLNWTGIAIGAVVAAGAIWALRKYKVL